MDAAGSCIVRGGRAGGRTCELCRMIGSSDGEVSRKFATPSVGQSTPLSELLITRKAARYHVTALRYPSENSGFNSGHALSPCALGVPANMKPHVAVQRPEL